MFREIEIMGTRDLLEQVLEGIARLEKLLADKSDEVLDARSACRLTGLSRASLYSKTCSKYGEPPVIPHFKAGKRIYFRKSELIAWMTANPVKDRVAIERDAEAYLADRAERRDAIDRRDAIEFGGAR
jgi:predicted DNA-binding transcriptional regulator AlpA